MSSLMKDEESGKLLGPAAEPIYRSREINMSMWPRIIERALILAAGLFPIIVVWSLPYLADWCDFEGTKSSNMDKPCFAHRCIGYPYCKSSNRGLSVSDYIATPPATGLVAMSNAWMFTHLWWVQRDISEGMWNLSFLSMIAFQFTFFCFLTSTVYYLDNMHNLMTLLMFLFGTVHYFSMLSHCTAKSKLWSRICIYCIIAAFIMNVIIIQVTETVPSFRNFKYTYGPYTYYYVEAFGVTAMNLFPWAWESEREAAYWRMVTAQPF